MKIASLVVPVAVDLGVSFLFIYLRVERLVGVSMMVLCNVIVIVIVFIIIEQRNLQP